MTSQLPNYLLSNRKRLALSQEEVAFLLGTQSGDTVCRHERFARDPNLETALAFQVIFQKPASELFGGLYEKVLSEVAARAKTLSENIDPKELDQQTAQKRQSLMEIAALLTSHVLN